MAKTTPRYVHLSVSPTCWWGCAFQSLERSKRIKPTGPTIIHYEPIAQRAVMNRGWTAKCIAKQSTKEWDCITDLSSMLYNCSTFKIIIGRSEGLWGFSTFNKKVRVELYKMMYVALNMRKWGHCILFNLWQKYFEKRICNFFNKWNNRLAVYS